MSKLQPEQHTKILKKLSSINTTLIVIQELRIKDKAVQANHYEEALNLSKFTLKQVMLSIHP